MTAQTFKSQKGFTLIELLVVIGILAVLLAITLIAINPARQFGQANDTKRRSDITQVLNAVGQYSASNAGNLPAGLSASVSAGLNNTTVLVGLCNLLVTEYLPALPVDPRITNPGGVDEAECNGTWDTGYTISVDANNRVTVTATGYDNTPITVTR